MKVDFFSNEFHVCIFTEDNVDEIYELCKENFIYYESCPPYVTQDGIRADLKTLPPGKMHDDKYYVGFYQEDTLIAVMDFINHYPEENIGYIGFFMTNILIQRRGYGTKIIDNLCTYLAQCGYHTVRLAWVKANKQAEHFWTRNKFIPIGEAKSNVADEVVLAERILK